MKKRIKLKLPAIVSRHEAETLVGDIAQIKLNQIRVTARMDAEIDRVRARFAPLLAECEEALTEKTEILRVWADANPQEFPKGRKSLALSQGTIGFRTGTPSLALVNRSWNWKKVLDVILAKRWRKFTRVKVEVDRDAILARAGTLKAPTKFQRDVLPTLGLKVVQEEAFFVEPNITDVEVRQVAHVPIRCQHDIRKDLCRVCNPVQP